MPSSAVIPFFCLILFVPALARRNQPKLSVRLAGLVLIQDGANPINHFVPQADAARTGRYKVVLGLPPQGLRWAMWRASSDPRMRIFGIQIKKKWYFLQVRKNGKGVVLVRQNVPYMVSHDSSRWFQYGQLSEDFVTSVLYHVKSKTYITTNSSVIGSNANSGFASEINIHLISNV